MRKNILERGPEPITITSKEQAEAVIRSILGGKAGNERNNENTTKTYNDEGK